MIFETFAQRKDKASRSGEQDVYVYDEAPNHLRHQLAMIFSDAIGAFYLISPHSIYDPPNANANEYWEGLDRICRKEIPSYLNFVSEQNLRARFCWFLRDERDIDDFLSAVELGCVSLSEMDAHAHFRGALQEADSAIKEINYRFVQHGVGYQFENGIIIRIDSQLVHAEVIKPALRLLTLPAFKKANDDFLTAHRHYRTAEYKDAVTAANRAFESILKAICDLEGWSYEKGDRAAELVTKVRNNGLFTHQFDKNFDAYVAMLKARLPSVRNDAGGHGEGLAVPAVTVQIARFAINLTASNILFIGESYETLKRGSN